MLHQGLETDDVRTRRTWGGPPAPRKGGTGRASARELERTQDAELVRRAADGCQAAWSDLVSRHRGVLRAVGRSYRLPEAQVDDAVQVAWVRLVEQIGRLRQPEQVRAWLVTTVRRECLQMLRAAQREDGTLETDDPAWGSAPPPEDELVRAEEHAVVRAALALLTERQRSLLTVQAASPELDYRQVSERCGLPVGSIGPTRGRALARLRVLLETAPKEQCGARTAAVPLGGPRPARPRRRPRG